MTQNRKNILPCLTVSDMQEIVVSDITAQNHFECFLFLLRFEILVFQLINVFDLSLVGTSSRGFEIKAKGKQFE